MNTRKRKSTKNLFILLIITLMAVPICITYAMPESTNETQNDIKQEQNIDETNAEDENFKSGSLENSSNVGNEEANSKLSEEIDKSGEIETSKEGVNSTSIISSNEVKTTDKAIEPEKVEKNDEVATPNGVTPLSDTPAPISEEGQNNEASQTDDVSNIECALNATIYDSNQYSTATGTNLTEAGIQINNWEHSTSKYLLINPTVPDDGNTYTVTVKLPKEFYVVGTELVKPVGYSDVKFTKNEGIYINKDFTYELNELSGTIEYTMDYKTISGTIQLELQYDYVLWDKQANSPITKEGVNPIEVILSKKAESVAELRKLVVNKVTSNLEISYAFYNQLNTESISWVNSAINAKKTDTVGLYFRLLRRDHIMDYKYYESLIITIKLPEYVDENENKYYLEPDIEKFNFNEIQYNSYYLNKDELADGILKLEYKKAYFSYDNTYLYFKPLNEGLISLSQDKFVFQNGKIYFNIKGNNGIEYNNKCSSNIPQITYVINEKAEVICGSSNATVTITERPNKVISYLGNFALENVGILDSGEKEIYEEFDTDNTGLIKVTTINIFADTIQENVEVQYTLIDDDGNIVYFNSENGNVVDSNAEGATNVWSCYLTNSNYNSATQTNARIKLNRENLPAAHQKYYFKSIKYNLKSIKTGARLYVKGSEKIKNGAGNFYGYIDKNIEKDINSKIEIKSIDDSNINDITVNCKTSLQEANTSAYGIDNIKINKTQIDAGDSFKIDGRINAFDYPYGTCTWIKGIRLGIILPNEISINESAFSANTSKNIQINDFNITSKDIDDNNKLWIIKFPDDIYIGYYNENLDEIDSGNYINFCLQLDTSYTMNNYTLFARDSIYVAGYKQSNVSTGGKAWAKEQDNYDLNEDGSVSDYIGRITSADNTNCQITSKPAELGMQDNILLNSNGNISEPKSKLDILTKDDIITYNLDIFCNLAGNVSDFLCFIPIPKKTSSIDNYLIKGTEDKLCDLKLQSFPEITGKDIYDFKYTFEQGLTYDTAKNVENWYSKEDIENDDNLKLEDVTMIKVSAKNGIIENGDVTRVSMNMKYGGDKYIEEAGMENTWHSGFFYKYQNGSIEGSVNHNTAGVNARITSSLELPEIELTAAKDMLPKIEGNINEYTTLEKDSNKFKNKQIFEITGVETYNIDLKTKTYIKEHIDMPGIEANKTFAITAQMNNGEETDILESSNTNSISLGELEPEELLELTYKIYNANAISDNSQTRYIIVTFESDNGVTVKQKININREITEAIDKKSAIIAGKNYLAFDESTIEVSISQDSAFTSQFVCEYIPSIYKEQLIKFSNELPIGTNIILKNTTDSENPKYWYYKMNTSEDSVSFKDFIEMGTKTNKSYTYKQGDDPITESFLVIVDFSQCTEALPVGTYNIKLVFKAQNISDFNSKELKFKTTSKRSFEITTDTEEFSEQEEVKINYSISSQESAESKYLGRKLSLVIKAPENMPKDAYIIADENNYNLNVNKQFIIPLKALQSGSDQIDIKLISNMFPNDETNYVLNIELWVSATSNAEAPMVGEKLAEATITYKTLQKLKPSLKVEGMNRRILNNARLTEENAITFEVQNKSNCFAYIELQKKIGNGYQKLTDKLGQVNEITEHNQGSFAINLTEGANTTSFKLNSTTEPGTYRLVIRLTDSDNNTLFEVPYNFLVLDE